MKTFKTKAVVIPSDLAERYDVRCGKEAGYLRNMLADMGRLQDLDVEVLSIGLMPMLIRLMEDKSLPEKPLSIERLSQVIYVTMMAYCMGTIGVDKDGDVDFINDIADWGRVSAMAESDKIKFPTGKVVETREFMREMALMADPRALTNVYKKVIGKKYGIKKEVGALEAFNIAKASMLAAKEMMEK